MIFQNVCLVRLFKKKKKLYQLQEEPISKQNLAEYLKSIADVTQLGQNLLLLAEQQ